MVDRPEDGRMCCRVIILVIVLIAAIIGGGCNEQQGRLSNGPPVPSSIPLESAAQRVEQKTATVSVGTPTNAPAATKTPAQIAQKPYIGIWVSEDELASLPTYGPAWDQLKAVADQAAGEPNISDQSQMNDVYVLAKALVYARTGLPRYRDEVIENLMKAMGTEADGTTLALGRALVAYIIAADLINLPLDRDRDQRFREWLRDTLDETLKGRTLRSTHEKRPNNWGAHTGASRAAAALYLGDAAELERTALVFKGYLGDRRAYASFEFGELWWQADPSNPVAINPKGAMKEGHLIDGSMPEEMRRAGKFRWPPKETIYAWEGLQGAIVQAEILHRAGYPTWEWENQALLRTVRFLHEIHWEPEGDDEWQPWLINYAYGTSFPAVTPARPGKNMGWTDWTHSRDRISLKGE